MECHKGFEGCSLDLVREIISSWQFFVTVWGWLSDPISKVFRDPNSNLYLRNFPGTHVSFILRGYFTHTFKA